MGLDKNNLISCWNDTLETLKTLVDGETFNTHFTTLSLDVEDDICIINCPNDFTKTIIKNYYLKTITEIFNKKIGVKLDIILNSLNSPKVIESTPVVNPKPQKTNAFDDFSMPLNPEFCFDTFIIGNHNRLATACGEAITKKPGKLYNPLFIYGDSGLGKTHLMQSIGNRLREIRSDAKIFYTTGENFTSLYVDAVRENKLQAFRKKIRSYDLFLLDDIQFLLKKESTITEFFHTFNALYESAKQIVLTSDRAPKDLEMDKRLLSRFEQGMFCDIKHPDFETRLAILKEKAENENITFPNDVFEYLANLIKDNIRQLQGALTRLYASASLMDQQIDVNFAKEELAKYYNNNEIIIDINRIQSYVSEYYNVTVADIIGQSRLKDIVFARQVSMYLARELTEMSLPSIGKAYGGRDHTTVMHSIKKIEERFQTEPGFRETINNLIRKITN